MNDVYIISSDFRFGQNMIGVGSTKIEVIFLSRKRKF